MTEVFAKKPAKGEPWDIAIIGSGPAGLTSAIYSTRGAASTVVFGGQPWGGQLILTTTVDNFPGFEEGIQGPELMDKMRKQAERFGAEFIEKKVSSVDFSQTPLKIVVEQETYTARAVIIATGADTKWLNVPGEAKLIGRGVSSCAPCDAPFFKNKNVIVVGGGDSAMEEALVLARYATHVTVVHRRDEFRASAAMVAKLSENKGISILFDTEVVEMHGENLLEKVTLKTKSDSKPSQGIISSNFLSENGIKIKDEEGYVFWEKPIDGIFVAIGHIPSTDIFKGEIELDEKGYIKKIPGDKYQMTTNKNGIFVAGDVHDIYYRQAITAAGFGCMAALEALKYLDKEIPNW
jgi:thioredoxin reductase (NADPH)